MRPQCPRCGTEVRYELLEESDAEYPYWRVICRCGKTGPWATTQAQAECVFRHPEYVETDQ